MQFLIYRIIKLPRVHETIKTLTIEFRNNFLFQINYESFFYNINKANVQNVVISCWLHSNVNFKIIILLF